MADVPAEQTGETQKALLTPFLTKTYQMVADSDVDDLISWNDDGTGFIIWKPAEFARDLLPKYFKHNNLSSFVRQLNTYGFRKVVPDRWEFANDFFKRGEKGLMHDIQRRKVTQLGLVSSAVPAAVENPSTLPVTDSSPPKSGEREEHMFLSSSIGGSKQVHVKDSTTPAVLEESEGGNIEGSSKSTSPELRKENRRLEKENQQMTDELSHLKGLCSNIFSMLSNYEPSNQQDHGNVSVESRQLDLLQSVKYLEEQGGSSGGNVSSGGNAGAMDDNADEDERSPMLFGVSIGAKRRKKGNEDEINHRQQNEGRAESFSHSNTARSEMKKEQGSS